MGLCFVFTFHAVSTGRESSLDQAARYYATIDMSMLSRCRVSLGMEDIPAKGD